MINNMVPLIFILIIILTLILTIYLLLKNFKRKFQILLQRYFNTTNLKTAIENSKVIENNTPKSVSSMESIIIPKINRDFPTLNINELKRICEENIYYIFNAIENKTVSINNKINDKIIRLIESKIADLNDNNIDFDSIKIHKTVVNNYENNNKIYTIKLQTSLEFKYRFNREEFVKTQRRFKTEFVYIINSNITKNKKTLSLNCPSCGAPINTKDNVCKYCGIEFNNVTNKVWIMSNIEEY